MAARSRWSAARCTRWSTAARDTGYLKDFPRDPRRGRGRASCRRDSVLYLCTGSQGEPRAALARIADGNHPNVSLGKGDAVIFSSRIIPGNELAIFELQNKLAALGVEVLTERGSFRPCLRPSLPRRTGRDVSLDAAADRGAGAWRAAPHERTCPARAMRCRCRRRWCSQNGQHAAPGARPRRRSIDEVPSGRIHLDGRVLVAEGDGLAPRPAAPWALPA